MREQLLALAGELEEYTGETCEECAAYEQPECKGHLSCMEIMARYAARKIREAVERDGEGATTVSAYDLLSEEDRKALAWVREHGGLGAVEKRLMPEGMEWPRFEDGEFVRFGDLVGVTGGLWMNHPVDQVAFAEDGSVDVFGDMNCVAFEHGETAKRIVLAADSEPLRVGETVCKLEDSRPYTVKRIDGDHVYINAGGKAFDIWTFPGKLTHEQPDTWERLEHDAEKTVCEYFGANYDCANCPLEPARCDEEAKKDIIRRAKKLAEREQ